MNILEEAQKLTNVDRQDIYGHPYDDFAKVAAMTDPIKASNIDPRLKHALYMIQVKVARLLNTPNHVDSLVDIAGYANTYAMILERMPSPEDAPDEEETYQPTQEELDKDEKGRQEEIQSLKERELEIEQAEGEEQKIEVRVEDVKG